MSKWCTFPIALSFDDSVLEFGLEVLNSTYLSLYEVLRPHLTSIAQQKEAITGDGTLADNIRYLQLLAFVTAIPGVSAPGILTGYRITIIDAQGTVMIDTQSAANTYLNWLAGTIGSNKNTRPAVMTSNLNPAGIGVESSFSPTLLVNRDYVSVRLGPPYQNVGQARIDQNAVVPISGFPIIGIV
jgi:hypothetical protein